MTTRMTRREVLQAMTGVALSPWLVSVDAVAAAGLTLGQPQPFSYDKLRERARRLSQQPFQAVHSRYSELLDAIDYDAYQQIRFRLDQALWAGEPVPFPVALFHLGQHAQTPVTIHALSNGHARQVRYAPTLFDYGDTGLGQRLPDDLGFSGFRVMKSQDSATDWLAFQGASYFRSSGPLEQYGMSARGIAVNTAVPDVKEEFPRFTAFWLERPQPGGDSITIYALLDGPSITGAYRFECRRQGAVVMDVHAELFQRADIKRLCIAPLTSMFWYDETNHRRASDWRPEIHDSDGLALWTGAGERIWRPLNNPPHAQTNSFVDENPKGFGLLQRDRNFGHYLDDSAFYNRRPGVWVEPLGQWGRGAVQLFEMPTDDEIYDNIVAYWVADRPANKDAQWSLDYRLHWVAEEPYPPQSVARVTASYLGRAGFPGQQQPRDPNSRKFVIFFAGGPLAEMAQRYDLEVVVEPSRGTIDNPYVLKVVDSKYWRAAFDLHADGSAEPINLRAYVRLGERTLSETWLYQYFPRDCGCEFMPDKPA